MSAARATGLLLGVLADSAFGKRKRAKPAPPVHRLACSTEPSSYSDDSLPGALYASGLAGSAVVLGLLAERLGGRSAVLRAATTGAAAWLVLGGSGISETGSALAADLENGDLAAARNSLAALGQHCAGNADAVELSRVSVETVAGHTAETVVAPLLWGAVAGVPWLVGARSVALLRRRLERATGRAAGVRWFSHVVDELMRLVPTRAAAALTVFAAPVVGGSAATSLRAWRRDTLAHPSPNAGRVEAAFAGALEVRLGGRTACPRGAGELPVLGDGRNPDAGHVTRAVELSRVVGWLAGISTAAIAAMIRSR